MNGVECSHYIKVTPEIYQCQLCPHECRIAQGKWGLCHTRYNDGNKLFYPWYGRIIAEHVDPIEKKPLFHFLPGSTTYSIASPGCNLQCGFCQNWQISQVSEMPDPGLQGLKRVTPESVVAIALRLHQSSISYTYSEPTVSFEFMSQTAEKAKKAKLYNVMITNGYINSKPLTELLEYIDAFNVDLKGMDEQFYRIICKGTLKPVLNRLIQIKKAGKWIEVTNLLIPGLNTDDSSLKRFIVFIKDSLGKDVPIHFSAFHPMYKLNDIAPTSVSILEKAYSMAKGEGLMYVYVGNLRIDGTENTYCSSCHKPIIIRSGYSIIEKHLLNGQCGYCKSKVHGIFSSP